MMRETRETKEDKEKKIVFLEHVSDVLFEARGATFAEALENAAFAMFETIADPNKLDESKKFVVEETGDSLEELAVFTLGKLLSESSVNELFLKRFKVIEFTEKTGGTEAKGEETESQGKRGSGKKTFFVRGVAFGSPATREAGRTDVKAVTFHEARVEQRGGEWVVRILLDI